jgi:chromosome partitioning protein
MTGYDGRKNLNRSVAELVGEMFGEKVFRTRIRENVSIPEATAAGRDVISYAPSSTGAKDYRDLGEELAKRGAGKRKEQRRRIEN